VGAVGVGDPGRRCVAGAANRRVPGACVCWFFVCSDFVWLVVSGVHGSSRREH